MSLFALDEKSSIFLSKGFISRFSQWNKEGTHFQNHHQSNRLFVQLFQALKTFLGVRSNGLGAIQEATFRVAVEDLSKPLIDDILPTLVKGV
jgi:hypothetical protein